MVYLGFLWSLYTTIWWISWNPCRWFFVLCWHFLLSNLTTRFVDKHNTFEKRHMQVMFLCIMECLVHILYSKMCCKKLQAWKEMLLISYDGSQSVFMPFDKSDTFVDRHNYSTMHSKRKLWLCILVFYAIWWRRY
jgi:hypothetical protein